MRKRNMKKLILSIAIIGFLSFGTYAYSCETCGCTAQSSCASGEKDIVSTAVGAGSFNTLAAALKAAGLVETLQGKGPFTVFAPTDDAFAKIPKETLASLLKPENRAKLTAILTYHVVPGKVLAKDALKLSKAGTVNGQQFAISVKEGKTFVNKAQIVKTDILCSNGVIHVIDGVILPNFENIVGTAKMAGKFNTLIAAVKAAGLAEALQSEGPFTVFAPTDDAFAALPEGILQDLLKPGNKDKLVSILTYHVVPGRVYSEDVVKLNRAATLAKSDVRIRAKKGVVKIDESKIVKVDIDTSNGVIHVIDKVLIPHDLQLGSPMEMR